MKREIPGGVAIAAVVIVVIVAAALLWKAVAPPAPAGIKSFDKESLKVMQQKHGESAREIQQEQQRLLQMGQGGGK